MSLLTIMTIFVVIAAIAIVLQMAILYAMYRAARETTTRLEGVASRLETQASPILATARSILDDAQPKIADIATNLAESTAAVRAHVAHMGEATAEIVERTRFQAARIDDFVSNTLAKMEYATEVLEQGVINPVRHIRALVQAVGAGLGVLRARRARRASGGDSVDGDEEMFI